MSTGLIWHESYMWHDSGAFFGPARAENFSQPAQHPESPETKRRFKNLLDISGLTEQLTVLTPLNDLARLRLLCPTPGRISSVRFLIAAGPFDEKKIAFSAKPTGTQIHPASRQADKATAVLALFFNAGTGRTIVDP